MNSAYPGGRKLAARAEVVLRRRGARLSAATQDQYSSALAAAQAELEREAHAETTLATVTIPLRLRETRVGRAVIDQRVLGGSPRLSAIRSSRFSDDKAQPTIAPTAECFAWSTTAGGFVTSSVGTNP